MKNAQVKLTVDTQSAVKSIGQVNTEITETAEVTKSLKAQLREMTVELQGLEPGTAEFNKMAAAAGQLRDQIKDTNAVIDATAGTVGENLAGAFTKTAGVGINAFQGLIGVQAMFGSDSKELANAMAKLQGAMAVGEALKGFAALGDTFTEVKTAAIAALVKMGLLIPATTAQAGATTVLAGATAAQAASTTAATAAQYKLNLAMLANPIFLIIAGITAAIAAFALFSDSSEDATANVEKTNAALENQISVLDRLQKQAIITANKRKDLSALDREDAQNTLENDIAILETKTRRTAEENEKLKALRKDLVSYNIQSAFEELQYNKEVLTAEGKAVEQKRAETLEAMKKFKAEADKLDNGEERNAIVDKYNEAVEAADGYSLRIKEINSQIAIDRKEYENKINDIQRQGELERAKAAEAERERARKAAEEKLQREKALAEKMRAYFDAIEMDRQGMISDAREKELQDAANHYDELTTLADAAGQSTVEITKNYLTKIKEINSRFDLDEANKKKKLLADIAVLQEETLLQEELNLADSEEKKELIRTAHYDKLLKLRIEQITTERDILLTNVKLTEEERQKIIAESNKEIAELNEKAVEDTAEKTYGILYENLKKFADAALEFYSNISSTVQAGLQTMQLAFDNYNAAQTAKRQEQYELDSEALDDALANRLISEEEYANQVEALKDQQKQKERAAKKKQFDQDKANNIINATISGALAVLQALANLPPPLSYVLAAVNAGLAAAQIALIGSQKFHAARGGVVPGMQSKVDSVDAKLAPGEMVINSSSASMFPTLLSEINKAGGGIPLAPEPVSNLTSGGRNIYAPSTQTVRAYVVEQELTNTSRRVKRMEESASF